MHRVTQKVFLCKIVLSVSEVVFLDQPGEIGRVHLLSTLSAGGQMDRSIKSTPGGVLVGLWAECNGYRTLTEEEGEEGEVLSWVCCASR